MTEVVKKEEKTDAKLTKFREEFITAEEFKKKRILIHYEKKRKERFERAKKIRNDIASACVKKQKEMLENNKVGCEIAYIMGSLDQEWVLKEALQYFVMKFKDKLKGWKILWKKDVSSFNRCEAYLYRENAIPFENVEIITEKLTPFNLHHYKPNYLDFKKRKDTLNSSGIHGFEKKNLTK